jgi:hypothetical protein
VSSGKSLPGRNGWWRTQSLIEPGSVFKFPGNREKYRENDKLGLAWAHSRRGKPFCDGHFLRNSLSNRTGKLENLNREIIFAGREFRVEARIWNEATEARAKAPQRCKRRSRRSEVVRRTFVKLTVDTRQPQCPPATSSRCFPGPEAKLRHCVWDLSIQR